MPVPAPGTGNAVVRVGFVKQVKSGQYFSLPMPSSGGQVAWGQLRGSTTALAIASSAQQVNAPILVVAQDTRTAERLTEEIHFFSGNQLPVCRFPDWETLPYDVFSPHQDVISQRLETLHNMESFQHGIIIIAADVLLQRLPPREWLYGSVLSLDLGQKLDLADFRLRLEAAGYDCVSQVMQRG